MIKRKKVLLVSFVLILLLGILFWYLFSKGGVKNIRSNTLMNASEISDKRENIKSFTEAFSKINNISESDDAGGLGYVTEGKKYTEVFWLIKTEIDTLLV